MTLVPDGPGWVEAVEQAAEAMYTDEYGAWSAGAGDDRWTWHGDALLDSYKEIMRRRADLGLRAALGGGSDGF